MNAIKNEAIPLMEYYTTSAEINHNCISLEESKKRVVEMVHKHFRK